jgi:hypothetical protein
VETAAARDLAALSVVDSRATGAGFVEESYPCRPVRLVVASRDAEGDGRRGFSEEALT